MAASTTSTLYDKPRWIPDTVEGVPSEAGESRVFLQLMRILCLLEKKAEAYIRWGRTKITCSATEKKDARIDEPVRVPVEGDVRFTQCLAQGVYSAALSEDGDVYTWGFGGSTGKGAGCLGHGNKESVEAPKKVLVAGGEENVRFVQIAGGKKHMLALGEDGEVWSWGHGACGKLGNNSSRDQLEPFPVDFFLDNDIVVDHIACGESHNLAVARDGRLFVWGRNMKGQLGLGGSLSMDVYAMEDAPTQVGIEGALEGKKVVSASGSVSHSVAIAEGGECYYWGLAQWIEPVRLTALQHHNIVKVSCGKNFPLHSPTWESSSRGELA